MLLAGEGRASFRRFLSRSGNSVLSPPKKGSRARTMVFRSQRSAMFFQHRRRRHPPRSFFQPPFSISPSYDLNSLDHIFAMFRPSNFLDRHPLPFSPIIFPPFSQLLPPEHSPSSSFTVVALLLPVLLQPRKSKLDAKTRPNVHNAQSPTYRVSGTIAGGHRFPPSGRDKCEDMLPENARRLVPRLL